MTAPGADAAKQLVTTSAASPTEVAAHLDRYDETELHAILVEVRAALVRAVGTIPELTPNVAATLTRRVSERLGSRAEIAVTQMEAVIRAAAGEPAADLTVAPVAVLYYALLVVGQLIHEDQLTVDDALGRGTPHPD